MAYRPPWSLLPAASAIAIALAAGGAVSAAPVVGPTGDAFTQRDPVAASSSQLAPQASHRTLQFDWAKNRWGLNLDVSQPSDRDATWRDARIGLNYRVAPGVRTGVGVTLGPEQRPDARSFAPQEPAPRVRLETTFKF